MNKAQRSKRNRKLTAVLGLLVSLGCLAWLFSTVDVHAIAQQFSTLNWNLVGVAVALTFSGYLVRALRWPYFFGERPPKYWASFRCMIVGFFMNNVLPARIGEFVRAHIGRKATGNSGTVVLATIFGERLFDGLTISLLFAVLFTFSGTSSQAAQEGALFTAAYLFALVGIGTLFVLLVRRYVYLVLEKLGNIMPGHVSQYTLLRVRRLIEGLEPMLKLSHLVPIVLLSVLVWSIELAVYAAVSRAFGQVMSLGELSLFMAAVNFSSLIPAAPAGIGVIEAAATLALVHIGREQSVALAMVACQHLIQIAVVGIPGVFFFYRELGGHLPVEDDSEERASSGLEDNYLKVSEREDEVDPEFPKMPRDAELWLSIVIPAFNEEQRIGRTLQEIVDFFSKQDRQYEVLVVSDGGTDNTPRLVEEFGKKYPAVRSIGYAQNRGKGHAVRYGVTRARGELILYLDADGATPIEEFTHLETLMDQTDADVVFGSRALFSLERSVKTVWYRKLVGRVYNGVVNLLILPGVADTQCGFKMFRRGAAREIFARQHLDGFGFDVELLFLARKLHFSAVEVPINWVNQPGSKVSVVRDSIRMFGEIISVRLRDLLGGY